MPPLAEMAPFKQYALDGAYDELFHAPNQPRPHYGRLYDRLCELPTDEHYSRQQAADLSGRL